MIKTYEEAVDWIHSRLRLGIKPGLSRMEWIMKKLDHPEKELKAVHIGGTNGKGSTLTILRNILEASGYDTGTFTSPYFEVFNERISVNGKPISDEEILELVNVIIPLAEELEETELGGPSEFEVITCMALYYFTRMNRVPIVLLEVGLGGRFDSTNVIDPMLSIITNIGLDHTQILGDTINDIAFEKAGIIKEGKPVVSAASQPDAQRVISSKAEQMNADLYLHNRDFKAEYKGASADGEIFDYIGTDGKRTYEIGMIGRHQTENAALAVKAADLLEKMYSYKIKESAIERGLAEAYWPGRMDKVSETPAIYLDGAHNPEGMQSLIRTIETRFKEKSVHILFAALKDKDLQTMVRELEKKVSSISLTTFDFPRAASPEELERYFLLNKHHTVKEWKKYLKVYINTAGSEDILIITGSLYFLSEVRPEIVSN
ncbi:bifunctional folylpolyglutamate synthase/dihydrofolate synthase [Rossellomorea vietnamensis]|uniref:Dihydrofolate synthase/folylpolyglutamate synthase n=1 Tax=Rossellomorea vietnamensis TaxID=218284 RepID=A0A5D4KIZ6_9BACI|nr:folylpolyglutamate synthase/dihydrofolate synthase family protein [Rossellomorea vietnamensis]TYR76849.1 bifunctional folylpolyglutamate synthase/dihydrofolate synthase [Rossellomorea vietnamensis]